MCSNHKLIGTIWCNLFGFYRLYYLNKNYFWPLEYLRHFCVWCCTCVVFLGSYHAGLFSHLRLFVKATSHFPACMHIYSFLVLLVFQLSGVNWFLGLCQLRSFFSKLIENTMFELTVIFSSLFWNTCFPRLQFHN